MPPRLPHEPSVIDQVIALAKSGLSRAAIAQRMSLTRSSVCGILWRRGISTPQPKPAATSKGLSHVTKPRPAKIKTSKEEKHTQDNSNNVTTTEVAKRGHGTSRPLLPSRPAHASGVSWSDLAAGHCRWPLANMNFCGEPMRHGSYCLHHAALAYRPATDRQQRRAA